MSGITGQAKTLADFLSQSPNKIEFIVPPFQRSYAWKEKNYTQWKIDIQKTLIDSKEYFVGPMISFTWINNTISYH